MSQDPDHPCNLIYFVGDKLKVYSVTFATFQSTTLVLSLGAWWYYRHLPFLKKRNVTHVLLIAIAWFCDILIGPVQSATAAHPVFINECVLYNILCTIIAPTILLATTLRVLLFNTRMELNKALSQEFETAPFGSFVTGTGDSLTSNEQLQKRLHYLRYLSTTRFDLLFAASGTFFSFVMGFLVSLGSCKELGLAKECKFVDLSSAIAFVGYILPALLFAVLLAYVLHKAHVRKYDDPFLILNEIKWAFGLGIPVVLLSTILYNINGEELREKEEVNFEYGLILDLGVTIICIYSLPYQIYLAKKSSVVDFDYNMSLKEVLSNEKAKKLFRQHLIAEFSVENLNFYEVATAFKARFKSGAPEKEGSQAKMAISIFNKFVSSGEKLGTPINISYTIYTDLKNRIFPEDGIAPNISADMFDEAAEEIYDLMEKDSFRRFKFSESFEELIELNTVVHVAVSPEKDL